jgi:hypothetical protein
MTAEGAPAHGTVAHLLPTTYKRLVAEWLEEDTPSLDYGGFVVGEDLAEAKLLGKSKVCDLCLSDLGTVILSHCLFFCEK